MSSFNDADGRTWHLNLTIGRLREIRDTSGIDLGDINGGGFLKIAMEAEKFVQVLWILIEKQADAQNVSPEQFAESLDGDTLDRASSALNEAIVRFSPAVMRTAMEKAISKILKASQEAMEQIVDRVNLAKAKETAISGALSQSSLAS